MGANNALTERLQGVVDDRDELGSMMASAEAQSRFSWHHLKADYLEIYRKVAQLRRSC